MNRIKQLRKKRGITQIQLCKIINVAQPTLSGYETGAFEPENETLFKIADFFGVSVGYLLGRDEEKTPSDEELSEGEKEWIKLYHALTPDNRDMLVKLILAFKDMPLERRRFILDAIRLAIPQK